jgi:hypothetical protein
MTCEFNNNLQNLSLAMANMLANQGLKVLESNVMLVTMNGVFVIYEEIIPMSFVRV